MAKNFICNGCNKPFPVTGKYCDLRTGETHTSTDGQLVPIDDALASLCLGCHQYFNQFRPHQLADYVQAGGGWGNKPDPERWPVGATPFSVTNQGQDDRPLSQTKGGHGSSKAYIDSQGRTWQAHQDGNTWSVLCDLQVVRAGLSSGQKARQYIRKQLGSKVQNSALSEPTRGSLIPLFRQAAEGSDEAADKLWGLAVDAALNGSEEEAETRARQASLAEQQAAGIPFTPDQLKVQTPMSSDLVWLIYSARDAGDILSIEKDIQMAGGYKQEAFFHPESQVAGYEVKVYDFWKFRKKLAKTYSACMSILQANGKLGRETYDLYRKGSMK